MTLMYREIMEQPEVLGRLYEKNEQTLRELVAELKASEVTKAVFAGRGTSDHAAVYAQYLLGVYRGVVSALAIPSSMSAYGAKLNLADCLVAGVSQSGRATDALLVLEQAVLQGASTIAVTNDASSPMARAAKYHLDCCAGEEKSVAATKTFTAQMYLVASLAALWGDSGELLGALRRVPEQLAAFLSAPPEALYHMAERFRYADDGFVLSRGFNYPVALECSLKLNETCYMKIKGYSASDFYHGPLAQLDEKSPVVVLAPRGALFEDIRALAGRIRACGAQVNMVTDDAALAAEYPGGVLLPHTGHEATSAFVFAAFAQLFAERLSVSRGLNPDEPRNLKKVTLTL
ncbi:MAG TPA: SIS domain-containing protein [Clostridia bacterium]|nr:SIS domain-containing protein [Clostridia bacterium]